MVRRHRHVLGRARKELAEIPAEGVGARSGGGLCWRRRRGCGALRGETVHEDVMAWEIGHWGSLGGCTNGGGGGKVSLSVSG